MYSKFQVLACALSIGMKRGNIILNDQYSPGTPVSSTAKTGRHDIVEILLKVKLTPKINPLEVNLFFNRKVNCNSTKLFIKSIGR
jgi:hypothetical protein